MKYFVDLVNYMQLRTNRLGNYDPINIVFFKTAADFDKNKGILWDRCSWIMTGLYIRKTMHSVRVESVRAVHDAPI